MHLSTSCKKQQINMIASWWQRSCKSKDIVFINRIVKLVLSIFKEYKPKNYRSLCMHTHYHTTYTVQIKEKCRRISHWSVPHPFKKILCVEMVFHQNTLNQTPNSTPHPQSHINQFGNFNFSACSHPVKPSANSLKEKIHYHKSQRWERNTSFHMTTH